ncbi:MAG: hypothetical protein RL757_25 [Bacteroidota bacterium]|jgi:hypothetical protein
MVLKNPSSKISFVLSANAIFENRKVVIREKKEKGLGTLN